MMDFGDMTEGSRNRAADHDDAEIWAEYRKSRGIPEGVCTICLKPMTAPKGATGMLANQHLGMCKASA